MANREACEVYIEQEIESGLEDGKTPYSIGKELSDWIAKLFEVRIKPDTLKKRAQRKQNKIGTNVPKESKTPKTIEDTTPKIIKDRHPQGGGKREGAGRKPLPDKAKNKSNSPVKDFLPEKQDTYSNPYVLHISIASQLAIMAISQLERIELSDPDRESALLEVKQWIEKQLNN